jgi:hypothetical protein
MPTAKHGQVRPIIIYGFVVHASHQTIPRGNLLKKSPSRNGEYSREFMIQQVGMKARGYES